MTWQLLTNLSLVAYAWIRTRAPEFGRLMAAGKQRESNHSFYKATVGSTLLLLLAASSFWIVLVMLQNSSFELGARVAGRFLAPSTTLWFAIAILPLHLTQCFAIHLRSRKIDPIWRISIIGNLILAASVFVAASQIGVEAVGIAMLVTFSIVMPLVFRVWFRHNRVQQGTGLA